ncbi:MAG: thioredoxin domain-containing protein [Defluviitaleaceae bacterium]|nr:thioredoxin domain-containing protein [Defluviitaleaceae bacterium]
MIEIKTVKNRLIHETSPYLLQHANNPVDWWPWCDEAFEVAKAENKPVLLSSGYSTCHWCHVMACESFEDNEIARILNKSYIAVKLDREERPDVDAVYMEFCQAMTGSGGWPLTVIMTPDKKPFFAGTYFPKTRKFGRLGLVEILENIAKEWKVDKARLVGVSEEISGAIVKRKETVYGGDVSDIKEPVIKAANGLKWSFDKKYGGFGEAPKFPSPHILSFLMRYYLKENEEFALQMVERTLKQMYRGGMFDHIGFGFSRYSTDDKWLAPHFEKMLYDNALLTIAYLECFMITNNEFYKDIALKVLKYVEREMTSPEGGFYSAQDADSGGVEGKYYTWAKSEIKGVLGILAGNRFCNTYGITRQGNFEGLNIPNMIETPNLDEIAGIDHMRQKLYEYRLERYHLHKDDKILTSWNGLMIIAYARAYQATGDSIYLETAKRAMDFIENNLMEGGEIYVSFREGKKSSKAMLDDYAFLCNAYIALYEASFDKRYMDKAGKLLDTVIYKFKDKVNGGFFLSQYSAGKEGELLFRPKEIYDGAMPSGNSILALCFSKVSAYSSRHKYFCEFENQIEFFMSRIKLYPSGYTAALTGVMEAVYPSRKLVCVFRNQGDLENVKRIFSRRFDPFLTVVLRSVEEADEYKLPDGRDEAFYLCEGNVCRAPVFDVKEIVEMV